MTRVLLATAAALILSAASVTTADAQRGGRGGAMGGGFSHGFSGGGFSGGGFSRGASPGGFSGGGFSRGASPGGFSGGGFARSAPAFRGGMASPGAQFRSGNFGNRSAVIGSSNQFRGPGQFRGSVAGGNQFRAIGPGNRFAGRHFRHGRRFAFAIGAPYYYDDYGYGYYDDAYPYDDSSCYETRRVHTRNGWRYRQVYVCN